MPTELFRAGRKALSLYVSAGFPRLCDAPTIIEAIDSTGQVDFIEVGIPYSDPVADGPTIQRVNSVSLENGINIRTIFDQLREVRRRGIRIPMVLMGHFNPVMQFGVEEFCAACKEVDVHATIIPDLPVEVYKKGYREIFEKSGVSPVFLITEHTPAERIREVDDLSSQFIYLVSSPSVTGSSIAVQENTVSYLKRIREMNLKNKTVVGFGIATKEAFNRVSEYADGAIVASEFLRRLEAAADVVACTKSFIAEFRS